jgi:predicted PurR-regulated permease PerM
MGMILSVPITVMMIVIFEEIPNLRFIAVFLSEKGDLNFILESKQEPLMDN